MEFSKKLREVENEILADSIKVVSFDLFDTLVVRPCIEPTDLFRIVAKRCEYKGNFVGIRKIAEQYARKKKPYYYDEITIAEIYEEFVLLTGISKQEANRLLCCELEVECDYIAPRYTIRELYRHAIERDKKVIIVTDVYLPKSFIETVLEKNGMMGYYKLYVSSEERISKGSGRLFQRVIAELEREGIEKSSIIHLGDNPRADVEIPNKIGIKSIHLPKAIGILNSKNSFKPLYEHGKRTDNCFLIGCLANYLFDDPFFPFNTSTAYAGKPELMGAIMFGPILLQYSKWMLENSIKDGIDKILFVYRDGYIPEKIYRELEKIYTDVPETDIIYLPRKVRYYFFGKEKTGLFNSLEQFEIPKTMTVNEFMEKRLLLSEEEKTKVWTLFRERGYVDSNSPMGDPVQYCSLMPELQKIFKEKTKKEIEVIEKYCKEKTEDTRKLAVVDVGYRGSVSRFLNDQMAIENVCYQILATPLVNIALKDEYHIRSFYSYSFQTVNDLKILHQLMEDVISIQEGTALYIEEQDNDFEVGKEDFSGENEVLSSIQDGIMKFVRFTLESLKTDFKNFEFDETLFMDLIFDFLRNPSKMDAAVIKHLKFEESNFIKIGTSKDVYREWLRERVPPENLSPSKKTEPILQKSQGSLSPSKKTEPILQKSQEKGEIINSENPWDEISGIHLAAIKICEKLHIVKFAIKVKQSIRTVISKKEEKNTNNFFEEVTEESLTKLSCLEQNWKQDERRILVAGSMVSFDKGICNYINQLAKNLHSFELILMSECIHLNEERTKLKIEVPFFIVPRYLGKDCYDTNTDIKCSNKVKRYVKAKDYLKWGVDNLLKRHGDMEEEYAYNLVYYAEGFINRMLDIIHPEMVILWNEFFAFHHILKCICEERKIKIIYLEFGSLPGTLSIEKLGQMGESFPGIYPEEFKQLPVSKKEIEYAEEVLDFLEKSKMNRNIQPINNNMDGIKQKLKEGRPTILYAGVNDFESGLIPYTKRTKEIHSPIFQSSEDAISVLSDLAKKYDWNLIYKPHPIIEKYKLGETRYEDNIILASAVDINEIIDISDVVVTILSQVSYISLIRKNLLFY